MKELKENIEKELESLKYVYYYYLEKSDKPYENKDFYETRINDLRIEIDTYEKVLEMIGE